MRAFAVLLVFLAGTPLHAQEPGPAAARLQPQMGSMPDLVSLSADGELVVTRDAGGVRVWSAMTGVELYTIPELVGTRPLLASPGANLLLGVRDGTYFTEESTWEVYGFDARGATRRRRWETTSGGRLRLNTGGDRVVQCDSDHHCEWSHTATLEADAALSRYSDPGAGQAEDVDRAGEAFLLVERPPAAGPVASVRPLGAPDSGGPPVVLRGFEGETGRFTYGGQYVVGYSDVNLAWGAPLGVWSTTTGERVFQADSLQSVGAADVSPTGDRYVVHRPDGLTLGRTDGTGPWRPIGPLGDGPARVAFSPDGARVLTWNGRGRLWDAATGRLVAELPVDVVGVSVSESAARFVTSGPGPGGRLATVWDWATGAEVAVLRGFAPVLDPARSVAAWAPDGRAFVTLQAGLEGACELRRVPTSLDGPFRSARVLAADDGSGCPLPAAVSPDGTRLLLLGGGDISVWTFADTSAVPMRLPEPEQGSYWDHVDARFSGDGDRVLVSATADPAQWGTFDAATGTPVADPPERPFLERLRRLERPASGDDPGLSVGHWSASRDFGRVLVQFSGGPDSVLVLDGRTGALVRAFEGTYDYFTLSPDGRSVASFSGPGGCDATPDGTVTVVDVETREERVSAYACSATFFPDGRHVATWTLWNGDTKDHVSAWNVETGEEAESPHAGSAPGFTPDGRFAVTGARDGRIDLWDPRTGVSVHVFLFGDGTWAVTDSDGRYDASDGGRVDGLRWVLDTPEGPVPAPLDPLADPAYEPGLLARHLGHD